MADYRSQLGVNVPSVPQGPQQDLPALALAQGLGGLAGTFGTAAGLVGRRERQAAIQEGKGKAEQVFGRILGDVQEQRSLAESNPSDDPRNDPKRFNEILSAFRDRTIEDMKTEGASSYALQFFTQDFGRLQEHEVQAFRATSFKKWQGLEYMRDDEALQGYQKVTAASDSTPEQLSTSAEGVRQIWTKRVMQGSATEEQASAGIKAGQEEIILNGLRPIVDKNPEDFLSGLETGKYDTVPQLLRDKMRERAYTTVEQRNKHQDREDQITAKVSEEASQELYNTFLERLTRPVDEATGAAPDSVRAIHADASEPRTRAILGKRYDDLIRISESFKTKGRETDREVYDKLLSRMYASSAAPDGTLLTEADIVQYRDSLSITDMSRLLTETQQLRTQRDDFNSKRYNAGKDYINSRFNFPPNSTMFFMGQQVIADVMSNYNTWYGEQKRMGKAKLDTIDIEAYARNIADNRFLQVLQDRQVINTLEQYKPDPRFDHISDAFVARAEGKITERELRQYMDHERRVREIEKLRKTFGMETGTETGTSTKPAGKKSSKAMEQEASERGTLTFDRFIRSVADRITEEKGQE